MARRRSSRGLAGVLAASLVALGACTGASSIAPPEPAAPAVLSPSGFYVDPRTAAAAQVEQWRADGRTEDAAAIAKIAEQPVPLWVSGDRAEVEAQTRDYVSRAREAGARPLIVAYNIPHRDCGSFSGGGAPDADYYRDWIAALSRGLDGVASTIVLEPDAVPHELSGCVDGSLRDERYVLLQEAVDELTAAGAAVYLDAGNPGFITDVAALADALRRSGVEGAEGFSLNVANFYATEDVVAFGRELSAALGGAPFIVDTSRNGNGRPAGDTVDGGPAFCNPPGRALGPAPTVETGEPGVNAYLWIKRVGESDGACRPGEPPAGQWWPEYALELAQRSNR